MSYNKAVDYIPDFFVDEIALYSFPVLSKFSKLSKDHKYHSNNPVISEDLLENPWKVNLSDVTKINLAGLTIDLREVELIKSILENNPFIKAIHFDLELESLPKKVVSILKKAINAHPKIKITGLTLAEPVKGLHVHTNHFFETMEHHKKVKVDHPKIQQPKLIIVQDLSMDDNEIEVEVNLAQAKQVLLQNISLDDSLVEEEEDNLDFTVHYVKEESEKHDKPKIISEEDKQVHIFQSACKEHMDYLLNKIIKPTLKASDMAYVYRNASNQFLLDEIRKEMRGKKSTQLNFLMEHDPRFKNAFIRYETLKGAEKLLGDDKLTAESKLKKFWKEIKVSSLPPMMKQDKAQELSFLKTIKDKNLVKNVKRVGYFFHDEKPAQPKVPQPKMANLGKKKM
ncbi:MAG: hypothetical protein P4M12_00980 [Gammaproteobacteria bacterium]|nr:hypothetical protein [Gammaproteobacteria bacterium]